VLVGAGAKDIAVSTHGALVRVKGTDVDEPNPVSCSAQEGWLEQVPSLVYPPPAVKLLELDSTRPITTEFAEGEMEGLTEAAAEPALLPNEVRKPAVVYPESSSIQIEPETLEPNDADIVSSVPEFDAIPYQMLE
jgi:hypothetical protein